MSFFTSFWDLPQKEQERFPCSSRLRSVGTVKKRSTSPSPWGNDERGRRGHLLGGDGRLLHEHLVDEAVLLGLAGAHEVVALGVRLDALDGLTRVPHEQVVELVARAQDFLGVDVDVRRLAREAAQRLVDEDTRVRQRVALALRARREEEGAHRGRLAHAERRDVGPHVLHGVVDRHARRHHAARRVDVQHDVLVRVLTLEEQELRDDDVRDLIVDARAEEDDAVLEEAREDVPAALAPVSLLDDRRDDEVAGVQRRRIDDGGLAHGVGSFFFGFDLLVAFAPALVSAFASAAASSGVTISLSTVAGSSSVILACEISISRVFCSRICASSCGMACSRSRSARSFLGLSLRAVASSATRFWTSASAAVMPSRAAMACTRMLPRASCSAPSRKSAIMRRSSMAPTSTPEACSCRLARASIACACRSTSAGAMGKSLRLMSSLTSCCASSPRMRCVSLSRRRSRTLARRPSSVSASPVSFASSSSSEGTFFWRTSLTVTRRSTA